MEGPRVGGVRLVDCCICGPTHRALKTRSCSRLIFFFFKKKILVLLSASVERFGVSRMLDFNLSKYSDMLVFMQNQKDSQALKYGLGISNALIRQPGDLAVLIVSIYNFTLNCL